MTYDEKRSFCDERVTLNGVPAVISGAREDFATVRALTSDASLMFSWRSVARIVADDRDFR